jgi:hypothetical protein
VTTSRKDERIGDVRSTDAEDTMIHVELDEDDRHLVEIALSRLRRPMITIPDEEVWKRLDA